MEPDILERVFLERDSQVPMSPQRQTMCEEDNHVSGQLGVLTVEWGD